MLKNVPKIIPPELLALLSEMGHGDELVIADGNFPSNSVNCSVVRMDGHGGSAVLKAVLELLPLDTYAEWNVGLMEVVKGDDYKPVIWDEYKSIIAASGEPSVYKHLERFAFYERAKDAYCVIATGEGALYANLIIKKGVIK